jgi:hypothetical protein
MKRRNPYGLPQRIAVSASWCTGPRTAAWDRLLQRVLAELAASPEASVSASHDSHHLSEERNER